MAPGLQYLAQKFGSVLGLPGMDGALGADEIREAVGVLLGRLPDLGQAIATSTLPARAEVADPHGLKPLFGILAPTRSDQKPVIFDRQELLARCRSKELRFHNARSRPLTDPEKALSVKGYDLYKLIGFTPSSPPGNGTLNDTNKTFEFCILKLVLEFLAPNRSKFQEAGRRGHWVGGERQDLVTAAGQLGFCDEAAQLLPELGLLVVEPEEYPIPPAGDFRCDSVRDGIVTLCWTLPAQNVDAVIVDRRLGSRSDAPWEMVVDKRLVASLTDDRSRQRGERFVYRIRPVFRNSVAASGTETGEIWVPDEPQNLTGQWADGRISLAWTPGRNAANTLIWRRRGGPPHLIQGRALDDETKLIATVSHAGPGLGHCDDDHDIAGGAAYWYTLAALYPDGRQSSGTTLKGVAVPKAPAAARRVDAAYRFDAVSGTGHIRVAVAPGDAEAVHTVVRLDPPAEEPVENKLEDWVWVDSQITVGKTYTYRVTPAKDGLVGTPMVSGPATVLPGVSGLRAEAGDRAVDMHYRTDPMVREVAIRRGEDAFKPQRPDEGVPVAASPLGLTMAPCATACRTTMRYSAATNLAGRRNGRSARSRTASPPKSRRWRRPLSRRSKAT